MFKKMITGYSSILKHIEEGKSINQDKLNKAIIKDIIKIAEYLQGEEEIIAQSTPISDNEFNNVLDSFPWMKKYE